LKARPISLEGCDTFIPPKEVNEEYWEVLKN
jgi:hypothetical protein